MSANVAIWVQGKAGGAANSGAIRKPANAALYPKRHVPEGLPPRTRLDSVVPLAQGATLRFAGRLASLVLGGNASHDLLTDKL